MAQYIQAPDFSYEPLPMQAYMQLAKEVAAGYAEGVNSANAYLASLPIATGALDDPNGDRAAMFRNQYGSKVEDAIQLYMDTKDKRSLASALTNITREMQSDEQLLSHNYLAANSDNILKRHQENPNGWFGYTKDGTSSLYTVDENGNRVSNLVSPTEVEGLGAAKNFYGNFLSGFDIANDTKWIDNYGKSIEKFKSQYGVTDPQTGKTTYQVAGQSYSNVLDAYKGGATQEFRDSVSAVYDTGSNAMARLYRERYGYQEGKDKFIEDTFRYRLPMEYGSETGFVDVAPSAGAGSTGTTTPDITDFYSTNAYVNAYKVLQDSDLISSTNFGAQALDAMKKFEKGVANGTYSGSLSELAETDAKLFNELQKAYQIFNQSQIEEGFLETSKGQQLHTEFVEEEKALKEEAIASDVTGILQSGLDLGLSVEDMASFNESLLYYDQESGEVFGSPTPIGLQIANNEFEILTEESEQDIFGYTSTPWYNQLIMKDRLNRGDLQTARFETLGFIYQTEPETETVTLDDLVRRGKIDLSTEVGKNTYNWIKAAQQANLQIPATAGGEAREPMTGSEAASYEAAINSYNTGVRDSEYYDTLGEIFESAEVSTQEVRIIPGAMTAIDVVDKKYAAALANEMANTRPDLFLQDYDIIQTGIETGVERIDPSIANRKGSKKVDSKTFVETIQPAIYKEGDRGKRDLSISAVTIPTSPFLKGGVEFSIGTGSSQKNYLLIPKDPSNRKYTKWLDEVSTSITGKDAMPLIESGPLAGLPGENSRQLLRKSNTYADLGLITGLAGSSVRGFNNFENRIQNSGVIEFNNQSLRDNKAFPVMDLDFSQPNLQFSVKDGKIQVEADQVIVFQKEDGTALTWEDYFQGYDESGNLSMFEMAMIVRSQMITNDIDRGAGEKLINKLFREATARGTTDGVLTITGKELNEAYKEEFGSIPDYTQTISSNSHLDAIDLYDKDFSAIRKK